MPAHAYGDRLDTRRDIVSFILKYLAKLIRRAIQAEVMTPPEYII
jgi:hypothetical protein